jgi:hypothetical protein
MKTTQANGAKGKYQSVGSTNKMMNCGMFIFVANCGHEL